MSNETKPGVIDECLFDIKDAIADLEMPLTLYSVNRLANYARRCESRMKALQKMIDVKDGFLAAYRTGSRPSEALWAKWEKAKENLDKANAL